MKYRYLVVSGGTVDKRMLESTVSSYKADRIVACDKGLEACIDSGLVPDVIIGDFDSVNKKYVEICRGSAKIITLDIHKDFTDTQAGISYCLTHKAESIVMVGASGTRMDHTIANIGLLYQCVKAGIPAVMVDAHNRIRMIEHKLIISSCELYENVSILPYRGCVRGITLRGFEYPAENLTLEPGDTIGISNKLSGTTASIELDSGYLIVIESAD